MQAFHNKKPRVTHKTCITNYTQCHTAITSITSILQHPVLSLRPCNQTILVQGVVVKHARCQQRWLTAHRSVAICYKLHDLVPKTRCVYVCLRGGLEVFVSSYFQ